MIKHNDYEIISLIREGDHGALELLFEKYSPLIYKKIYYYNLMYDKEDMFQEGLMMLHKSLSVFKESFSKSFTRYFEMNLDRRYMSIISKRVRRQEIFRQNELYIYETNHCTNEASPYFILYMKEISKILTKTEKLVYTLRELNNYSIAYIKEKHSIEEKVIYNSLYRAKTKINSHFTN